MINGKRNWSAPGPDRIVNFWWKKATSLHKEIDTCFQATAQLEDLQFPLWFSEGKTTLIPKPGEFRSDNQRPITCLNNLYKWYTSCLLAQANQHIETYGSIQREQRGARGNCSGTVENLLIDRMVCEDAQRGKRNFSMAWLDVTKAYDSVDHGWLSEMFTPHRFPIWFAKVMEKLANSWNTRIVAQTTQGKEISPTIRFKKGLPPGDGNEKKWAVIHVKWGQVDQGSGDMKVADLKPIKSWDQHNTYKFLGDFENAKQEDKQVLEAAAKTYLQRLPIIWSSPLSDHAKIVASNQCALPVLTYLMWTQT